MSHSDWHSSNDAFLANWLTSLRQRFERLLSQGQPSPSLSPAIQAVPDREYMPAAEILRARLGLSAFERDVLLLCAAMELDASVPGMCGLAQGDACRTYPTFALAMQLFDEPAWEAISPIGPLRRLRLIEIHQPANTPLTAAALRADERVVNFMKGLNELDAGLLPLLVPNQSDLDIALPLSQSEVVDSIVEQIGHCANDMDFPVVQLVGADRSAKQLIARHVAARMGFEVHRLMADALPSNIYEGDLLVRLWEREARLLSLALYLEADEIDISVWEQASSTANRLVNRSWGLVFLDTREARQSRARPVILVDVAKPTVTEQCLVWREVLQGKDDIGTQLAGQFHLNTTQIHQLAQRTDHDPQALWQACRRATRPSLDALAQRIDAKATWDDLVLPADELRRLRQITDQVRYRGMVYDDWGFGARNNRGLGLSVLFAGESGTGKTMAAEVIANDLALDLYRIDLSAVVNKYIGETEKNLRRLFDAADDGGAILFFDESDSLFGKRTEVKDSHDRYANLETNYLLQRIESYRGLAILATNLKTSIDKAFLRRLRFVVDFPLPEVPQRYELWRKAFPDDSPLASLDYERLSRMSVTGGNIHTIALNAAFAAAGNGRKIDMGHLIDATRSEYRKLQKPITANEFRHDATTGSRT